MGVVPYMMCKSLSGDTSDFRAKFVTSAIGSHAFVST